MNNINVLRCFPNKLSEKIKNEIKKNNIEDYIEEIRIRNNLPVILKFFDKELILDYLITSNDIEIILQRICENSIYAYQKQIANGYVTIQGGNRVGVVGSGVLNNEELINLNYISGLNFRISRQVVGCSKYVIGDILSRDKKNIYNTLIISPPGMGKTTLIKDIIKTLSNGTNEFKGFNICVIDERGEIAASHKGIAQNDLGIRTDVLDNVPKAIGMKMAIRSMAPQIIVADEIGGKQDAEAIRYAIRCGVKGIFTAHAGSLEELIENPEFNKLINEKIFEKIILLQGRKR